LTATKSWGPTPTEKKRKEKKRKEEKRREEKRREEKRREDEEKRREDANQVAAPTETRTPTWHRANTAHQRVRIEGWRQRRLG
jgi:hypothetical protein